jgi:hypothetical protein
MPIAVSVARAGIAANKRERTRVRGERRLKIVMNRILLMPPELLQRLEGVKGHISKSYM